MDIRFKLSEQSKDELIDIILETRERIKELERELKRYKNPNTPSSSNKHIKPDTLGLKAEKKEKLNQMRRNVWNGLRGVNRS